MVQTRQEMIEAGPVVEHLLLFCFFTTHNDPNIKSSDMLRLSENVREHVAVLLSRLLFGFFLWITPFPILPDAARPSGFGAQNLEAQGGAGSDSTSCDESSTSRWMGFSPDGPARVGAG